MRAHEPASFGQENVKAVILLRVLEKIAKNVRHGRNYFCTFYLTSKFAVCRMVAKTLYSKLSYVFSFSILKITPQKLFFCYYSQEMLQL